MAGTLHALPAEAAAVSCVPDDRTAVRAVLFTDIVGSTALQATLGDCDWRDLLLAHRAAVRSRLQRWRGFENDTAGDGFYITFPDPADAASCALDLVSDAAALGIQVRAGLHVGSCELVEERCSGLTVSIGARVAALAAPSEVLVTEAVRRAVGNERFTFVARGRHLLKGVPGRWPLYRVRAASVRRAEA